ncbi:MAG: 50S ribosomal protein L18 [Deltaproteobacteria bacterium]|jgi:large subunit ribosomal protein L18|nr:MAG: 50S ribosomal protein L18 [Deltaproteobacteria bacterium]
MIKLKSRKERRAIRHRRVRKKVKGTASVPRLSVFKSSKHIYAQVIDDEMGHTLVAASSLTPRIREILGGEKKRKVEVARLVGKYVGELCLSKGIKKVCFDRGGYPYHGRVKALAEGAREAGLEF